MKTSRIGQFLKTSGELQCRHPFLIAIPASFSITSETSKL